MFKQKEKSKRGAPSRSRVGCIALIIVLAFVLLLSVVRNVVIERPIVITPTLALFLSPTTVVTTIATGSATSTQAVALNPSPTLVETLIAATQTTTRTPVRPTLTPTDTPFPTRTPTSSATPQPTFTLTARPVPRGDKILFLSLRNANREIFIMDTDGANQHRLVRTVSELVQWLPDALHIAYAEGGLIVADADGSNPRQIAKGDTGVWNRDRVAWSPDGQHVLFVLNGKLNVVSVDGSDQRVVSQANESPSAPAWTPDGQQITYINAGGLMIMNADGTGSRPLFPGAVTSSASLIREFVWSPNGQYIAYIKLDQGQLGIYRNTSDGSNERKLTPDAVPGTTNGFYSELTWSPDGQHLAYLQTSTPNKSGGTIYVMNTDGSDSRQIVPPVASGSFSPTTWSPDGQQIAYSLLLPAQGAVTNNIYVARVDGTSVVQLTTSGRDSNPVWMP